LNVNDAVNAALVFSQAVAAARRLPCLPLPACYAGLVPACYSPSPAWFPYTPVLRTPLACERFGVINGCCSCPVRLHCCVCRYAFLAAFTAPRVALPSAFPVLRLTMMLWLE
jgi:hypothetical protein